MTGETASFTGNPNRTAYSILGLQSTCTQDDISRAYKVAAAQAHPDRPNGDQQRFTAVSEAHEMLSNPLSRALYDLEAGIVPDNEANRLRIHRLRRTQAMQQFKLMFNKVHIICEREQSRNGLLIVSAKYGDLDAALSEDRVLDVTMQLQSFVEDSLLILRGNESKSWLEGFYDPTQGGINRLHVVYKLGGELHQVDVDEWEELVIPQQSHLMNAKQRKAFEQQFSLSSERLNEQAIKRRRRYIAFASLTVGALGAYAFYRHRKYPNSTLLPGFGGIRAANNQIASIFTQWIEFLAQYSRNIFGSSQPSQPSIKPPQTQLGTGLVKTNSAQFTNDVRLPAK